MKNTFKTRTRTHAQIRKELAARKSAKANVKLDDLQFYIDVNAKKYDAYCANPDRNAFDEFFVYSNGEYKSLNQGQLAAGRIIELICAVKANALLIDQLHGRDAINYDGFLVELKSSKASAFDYELTKNGAISRKGSKRSLFSSLTAKFKQRPNTMKSHFDVPVYFVSFDADSLEAIDVLFMHGNEVANLVFTANMNNPERTISYNQFAKNGYQVSDASTLGMDEWKTRLENQKVPALTTVLKSLPTRTVPNFSVMPSRAYGQVTYRFK